MDMIRFPNPDTMPGNIEVVLDGGPSYRLFVHLWGYVKVFSGRINPWSSINGCEPLNPSCTVMNGDEYTQASAAASTALTAFTCA
jgi:hypothetical protein